MAKIEQARKDILAKREAQREAQVILEQKRQEKAERERLLKE